MTNNMKKSSKKIIYLLSIFIIVFSAVLPAYADMGPKRTITIIVPVESNETIYAALYTPTEHFNPVRYGDRDVDEAIFKIFSDHAIGENMYFTEEVWNIYESHNKVYTGYIPPDNFKLVLYYPQTGKFLESDICGLYAFDSRYIVFLSDTKTKLLLEEKYDFSSIISNSLMRLVGTLIVESLLALVFGIWGVKPMMVILGTNVVTQLILNLLLGRYIYKSGGGFGYLFLFFFLEIIIIVAESIVYACTLPNLCHKQGKIAKDISRKKAVGYSITANLVSWLIMPFVITYVGIYL